MPLTPMASETPEPPDPTTSAHFLSIPAFLLPLSPSLAALHHARVKLHLSPTASSSSGSANAAALKELERRMKREAKGWCVHCGALRAARGKGPAELGQGEAGGSNLVGAALGVEAEVKGKGKGRGKCRVQATGRGKRRKVDGSSRAEILPGSVDDSSSVERVPPVSSSTPLLASLAQSAPDDDVATVPPTTTRPRATPTPQRRPNDCDTCGTPYSRPSPMKMKMYKPALPAARVLRKRNSTVAPGSGSLSGGATDTDVFGGAAASSGSEAGSADVASAAAGQLTSGRRADIIAVGLTEKSIPAADIVIPSSSFASSPSTPTSSAQSSVSSAPPQSTAKHSATPKTKQAPPFRYIPSTPSALPSYPPPSSQPPVRPEPTRASSSTGQVGAASGEYGTAEGRGSGSGASAASSAATARKKSKKSGLAKLLAQSKERDQSASGGNWGFA